MNEGGSGWRAWWNLVLVSWQRQARARWLTWIALGLLVFTVLLVFVNTRLDRWNMARWRPSRGGMRYSQYLAHLHASGTLLAGDQAQSLHAAISGSAHAVVHEGSSFYVFSNVVVFFLYGTILLPLWTLSFATEGLGYEREARNLIWVLTRPLSRPAIFLAKFVALLPWCLLLNFGGLALICLAGGEPGRLALRIYWPSVLLGTLAFAALFHALAALVQRAALVALLYSFFFETIAGNLPGHLKRLSISFHTRCLMFDRAHEFSIQPERPSFYIPVSGTTATWILIGGTIVLLAAGTFIFSRREYLDLV